MFREKLGLMMSEVYCLWNCLLNSLLIPGVAVMSTEDTSDEVDKITTMKIVVKAQVELTLSS